MTIQVKHGFEYEDEIWHVLFVSRVFSGHIVPPEFTLQTRGNSTAGGPGYNATFALDGNRLIVRHFYVTGDVMLDEYDENGHQRFVRAEGSRADWESERRWQVFPRLPSINGKLPEVRVFKRTTLGFKKKSSFDATNPETYVEPYQDEYVDCGIYRDLNVPVVFTGGMILGFDAYGGHSNPCFYKRVLELSFEEGMLTEVIDQAELVSNIVAGAEQPTVAMFTALGRFSDDVPHFKHVYVGYGWI